VYAADRPGGPRPTSTRLAAGSELLWDLGRWREAAKQYDAVVARDNTGEYTRTCAFNAVLAWEKIVKKDPPPVFKDGKIVSTGCSEADQKKGKCGQRNEQIDKKKVDLESDKDEKVIDAAQLEDFLSQPKPVEKSQVEEPKPQSQQEQQESQSQKDPSKSQNDSPKYQNWQQHHKSQNEQQQPNSQ
jgi:hypothetical protein